MNYLYIFSQIFSIISLILVLFSYFAKSKTTFLLIQCVSIGFYGGSYLFVGATVAGLINLVSIVKTIVFYYCQKHCFKKDYIFLFLFLAINVVISIVFWKSPLDVIPLITSSLYTFVFFIKDIQVTRYISIVPNCMLFVYNIILATYINSVQSMLEIVASVIAIIKCSKDKKKNISIEDENGEVKNDTNSNVENNGNNNDIM